MKYSLTVAWLIKIIQRENFQRSKDVETLRRLTKDDTKVDELGKSKIETRVHVLGKSISKIETGVSTAWFWRFFCQLLRIGKGAK